MNNTEFIKLMNITNQPHKGTVHGWQIISALVFLLFLVLPSIFDKNPFFNNTAVQAVVDPPLLFFVTANAIQALFSYPLLAQAFYDIKNRKVTLHMLSVILIIISCSYMETTGILLTVMLLYRYINEQTMNVTKVSIKRDHMSSLIIEFHKSYSKRIPFLPTFLFVIVLALVIVLLSIMKLGYVPLLLVNTLFIFSYGFMIISILLMTRAYMLLERLSISKQGLPLLTHKPIKRVVFVMQQHRQKKELRISFFHNWNGNRERTLSYLMALEQPLQDPIALAIRQYAKQQVKQIETVKFWQHYRDMGVGGYIDKRHIIVGNERLIMRYGYQLGLTAKRIAKSRQKRGEIVFYVFDDGKLIALVGFCDMLQERLNQLQQKLHSLHINVELLHYISDDDSYQDYNVDVSDTLLVMNEPSLSKGQSFIASFISRPKRYDEANTLYIHINEPDTYKKAETEHLETEQVEHETKSIHIDVNEREIPALYKLLYLTQVTLRNIVKFRLLLNIMMLVTLFFILFFGFPPTCIVLIILSMTIGLVTTSHKLHLHHRVTHVI